VLPPLRDAAGRWGVNLHTVRRAYKALEVEGLVETRRPTGTRVAALGPSGGGDRGAGLKAFVARMAAEGRTRFGLGPGELADALRSAEAGPTSATATCCVAECSHTLSRSLAETIGDALGIVARPFDVRHEGTLPPGPVVGTYFHADELRQRLAQRTGDLYLVRIRLGRRQMDRLRAAEAGGALWKLVILDRLPASAHDIAADFEAALGRGVQLEVRVLRNPLLGFPDEAPGATVIASPQTWDELTPQLRARPDVELLEYEIEGGDLARLEEALGGRPPG
jgi:hypothetical protein